jgi:rare lipoprotein A
MVRVTELGSGKSVKVRINDRGPFLRDRIIDLSYEAARKLGIVARGTARVEVAVIGRESRRKTSDPG